MINKLFVFCLFLFTITLIKAQEKDSILYIIPDSVEVRIYEETKKIDLSKFNLYFFLSKIDKNIYRINYSSFPNDSKSKNPWIDNTNRFLIVNNRKFPLIFDYDSSFSTQTNTMLGSFGEREGNIQRSYIIFEGYSITFKRDGTIISEDYGIFKKVE